VPVKWININWTEFYLYSNAENKLVNIKNFFRENSISDIRFKVFTLTMKFKNNKIVCYSFDIPKLITY